MALSLPHDEVPCSAVAALDHVRARFDGVEAMDDSPFEDAVGIALNAEVEDQKRKQEAALAREALGLGHLARDARRRLVEELRRHVIRLRADLAQDKIPDGGDEQQAMKAAARADAGLADYLDQAPDLGPHAASIASKMRQSIPERQAAAESGGDGRPLYGQSWRLWVDGRPDAPAGPYPFLTWLAKAIWHDVVMAEFKEALAQAEKEQLSVAARSLEDLNRYHRPGNRLVETDEGETVVVNRESVIVAQLDATRPPPVPVIEWSTAEFITKLQKGVRQLGSLMGFRVLDFELRTGWEQACRGDPDFRRVAIEGGYRELTRRVLLPHGLEPTSPQVQAVKCILLAQAHLPVFDHRNHQYRGNLIALSDTYRARGGWNRQRSYVSFVMGDLLLPYQVKQDPVRDRYLVPVVGIPPLLDTGRRNDDAPQAALALMVSTEIARGAKEVIQHGGVRIDRGRWNEMAAQAGFPIGKLDRLLDLWTRDGDDGPAFLERVGRDRWFFGPQHDGARLLVERRGQIAGKRRKKGRNGR